MSAEAARILSPVFPTRTGRAQYREALQQIPGGVGLVTSGRGPARLVATAISVAPLSADPPMLIVCLDARDPNRQVACRTLQRFGLSILAAQHGLLAERYAEGPAHTDPPASPDVPWIRLGDDAEVIGDSVLAFACEVEERIERHDQAILIGRIVALHRGSASSALVYWRGLYDRIGWTAAEIACATGLTRPG